MFSGMENIFMIEKIILLTGGTMSLKYQIESINGLDESIANLYEASDNGFVLKVDGIPTKEKIVEVPIEPKDAPDVSGLKSALKKERDARKNLEKQAKQYEGLDLEAYKNMAEKIKNFDAADAAKKKKEAEKKGQWEKLEQDLKSKQLEQLNELTESAQKKEIELTDQLSELKQGIEREVSEKSLIQAISDAKGNTTVLMPHVKDFVKAIKNDDGKYEAIVVDNSGDVRTLSDGSVMKPNNLIDEFKEKKEFSGLFEKETTPGGSDSDGGHGGGGTPNNPFKKDSFNLTQQALLIKKDPAKAKKLKQEAGIE